MLRCAASGSRNHCSWPAVGCGHAPDRGACFGRPQTRCVRDCGSPQQEFVLADTFLWDVQSTICCTSYASVWGTADADAFMDPGVAGHDLSKPGTRCGKHDIRPHNRCLRHGSSSLRCRQHSCNERHMLHILDCDHIQLIVEFPVACHLMPHSLTFDATVNALKIHRCE